LNSDINQIVSLGKQSHDLCEIPYFHFIGLIKLYTYIWKFKISWKCTNRTSAVHQTSSQVDQGSWIQYTVHFFWQHFTGKKIFLWPK